MTWWFAFKPRDLRVGVYWTRRDWQDWCDDPQCGDSTWDHYCGDAHGSGIVVYVCLLPTLPLILDFRPEGKDFYR